MIMRDLGRFLAVNEAGGTRHNEIAGLPVPSWL